MTKKEALASLLGVDAESLLSAGDRFLADGEEWMVLTEQEADDMAYNEILDLAWAFNTGFLEDHADPRYAPAVRALEGYRRKACEESNDATLAMIYDKREFVHDAIALDGRGHFLSTYDGTEHYHRGFYLYRTN